jgi:tetratricopeptide (TPR) repeat protein
MPTPPRNPYIAGKALGDARGFFGREDVFRLVETVLSSPDQNSVVLFGQRRIGKTSILLNLDSRLPSPPFVPVYFDLMDRARKPLGDVLYELAATIAQEMNLPQPARADFDDEGHGFRERFLPTAYAALGGQKRLVLLFDEFDVLDVTQEEQLPAKAAARAFFPYLRALMTNEPRLGFVFVVGRKAEELGIEFKAAFKASRYYRVSVLDEESARALVVLAERDGLLHFADGAVERVLALTARHPYFTQLMCQLLFERAHQSQSAAGSVPTVATADVDAVVPKVLEAGENVFEWIWGGLRLVERVIFSAIASVTDEQTILTEELLINILQSHGIRILMRAVELAPKTLIEWEMLKQANGGYRFFAELLRRWVVERKPLAKVKDELDLVVPLAESLFQSGGDLYWRGMYDDAIMLLQGALKVNPNHLKARLMLGEIYRGQGKFDDAIRELKEVCRIDEDAGRKPLEIVLQQKASESQKQKASIRQNLRWSLISAGVTGVVLVVFFSGMLVMLLLVEPGRIDMVGSVVGRPTLTITPTLASTPPATAEPIPTATDTPAPTPSLTPIPDSPFLNLTGHTAWVSSVAFSPDGSMLASAAGTGDNTIQLWRVKDGIPTQTLKGHTAGVLSAAFSPDGGMLASGSVDKTVRFWRVSDGALLQEFKEHEDRVWSVAFSPDGAMLASGSADKSIMLWQVSTGSLIRTLPGHTNVVRSVVFSPDGATLASGSEDKTARLWQVRGGILIRTLPGHTEVVRSVAFSPNGAILASASWDGTIRLWEVSGLIPPRILRDRSMLVVRSVAFSPDGAAIASGSDDMSVRLWLFQMECSCAPLRDTQGLSKA